MSRGHSCQHHSLLHCDRQQLRSAYNVVKGRRRGFIDIGLAADDHFLVAPHAIHYIHHADRKCRHDFVGYAGFGIGLQQRHVKAVVGMLFVQQRNG